MKYDIITIGSAVRDIFLFVNPEDAPVIDNPKRSADREKLIALEFGAKIDVSDSRILVGGGGVNTATTFSRQGLKTACVVSVGEDENGKIIEDALKEEKVARSFLRRTSSSETAFSVLIVTGAQKRDRVALVDRGASDFIDFSSSLRFITSTEWYYTTALSGENWEKELDDISKTARDYGIKWAWNPGSEQISSGVEKLSKFMRECDVFIVNKDEAIELIGGKETKPKDLANSLLSFGVSSIIISHGPEGAYYADNGTFTLVRARKSIKAKEPTGAGDALGAGFVAGLIKYKWNIKRALELGVKNSESVIQKYGAREGILLDLPKNKK